MGRGKKVPFTTFTSRRKGAKVATAHMGRGEEKRGKARLEKVFLYLCLMSEKPAFSWKKGSKKKFLCGVKKGESSGRERYLSAFGEKKNFTGRFKGKGEKPESDIVSYQ